MSKSELTNINENHLGTVPEAMTPANLIAMAVQQGAGMDTLERLMDMKERWEASEARKAYVVAMNKFKKNPPEIFKNKHVEFQTSKGTTAYDHATLDHIVKVIGEGLSKNGLSHRWDVEQLDGGLVKVTCIITHVLGHSESVPMQAGLDQSGGKNNIQALGSTTTYLQRYTLLAATGLASKDQDDDGAASEQTERLNQEQQETILALITEVGADKHKFYKHFKINDLSTVAAVNYKVLVDALEAKRKAV